MADRVLNFKEFADKFSEDSEQNQAASVQDVASASDKFAAGFDEETYDKSELGPNKPVSIGSEDTPAQPGEDGAPSFYPTTSGIESPSEDDDCEDCDDEEGDVIETEEESDDVIETEEESDEIEDDGSYGNPEGDDDEDDDEDGDEDDDDDEDEESNESFKWSTSKRVILESFDNFEGRAGSLDLSHLDMDDDEDHHGSWEDHNDMYRDNDVELLFNDDDLDIRDIENDSMQPDASDECFVICQKCGATKMIAPGDNPMSADKVDDPDSWWQGAEYGMHCGAGPCSK